MLLQQRAEAEDLAQQLADNLSSCASPGQATPPATVPTAAVGALP
jgi:hypothetical protein